MPKLFMILAKLAKARHELAKLAKSAKSAILAKVLDSKSAFPTPLTIPHYRYIYWLYTLFLNRRNGGCHV